MRRSPKRQFETTVDGVSPALNEDMREGDEVRLYSPHDDPRLSDADLTSAFLVPNPFYLQPLYFKSCLQVPDLTSHEKASLSSALGNELPSQFVSELQSMRKKLVITLILKDRLPSYRDLFERLQEINAVLNTCQQSIHSLMKLTGYKADLSDRSAGFMTIEQCLSTFLASRKVEFGFDTHLLREALEPEFIHLKSIVSKRGRKEEIEIRLLLKNVFSAALRCNVVTTLPSNDIGEGNPATTPFFRFLKKFLQITYDQGTAALALTTFSDAERSAASGRLKSLKKHDGALLAQLRPARDAARTELAKRLTEEPASP